MSNLKTAGVDESLSLSKSKQRTFKNNQVQTVMAQKRKNRFNTKVSSVKTLRSQVLPREYPNSSYVLLIFPFNLKELQDNITECNVKVSPEKYSTDTHCVTRVLTSLGIVHKKRFDFTELSGLLHYGQIDKLLSRIFQLNIKILVSTIPYILSIIGPNTCTLLYASRKGEDGHSLILGKGGSESLEMPYIIDVVSGEILHGLDAMEKYLNKNHYDISQLSFPYILTPKVNVDPSKMTLQDTSQIRLIQPTGYGKHKTRKHKARKHKTRKHRARKHKARNTK
jgi:hypothetical protein